MLPTLTAMALGTCGPAASETPEALRLRGHDYALVGVCLGTPVLRTDSTDSTSHDRAEAPHAVILVTGESVDPESEEGGWPGPLGNLYLSTPYPGPPEAARGAVSEAVEAWAAPLGLSLNEGWDGPYGAHREPEGRFMTGLVVEPLGQRSWIGLDLHLNATPEAYAALGAEAMHVSAATLTGQPQDLEAALWTSLRALLQQPG
ncbi:MAG: hypothetical protein H6741_13905 [Alphaproteobacteria bacterium]|nr:hypothetical protein [Alphaproteobacteria bacterium]